METCRAGYAATLASLPPAAVAEFLTAHSNLPGPRANLTLLDAAGDVLSPAQSAEFFVSGDEYLACCGVVATGRLLLADPDNPEYQGRLLAAAGDARWRVRESAAIAAQHIGDEDPARLRRLVADWVAHSNPLVVRAGIAAICEPRLLADPRTATAALAACADATRHLLATTGDRRRDAGVRTLRQGLGYCWSVAVAGDPEAGLPLFLALDVTDPDLAWVVRENRRKRRLARLLP